MQDLSRYLFSFAAGTLLFTTVRAQGEPSDFRRVFEKAVAARGLEEPVEQVLEHLREDVPKKYAPIPTLLPFVQDMLSDVYSPPRVAEEVRDTLAGAIRRGRFGFEGRMPLIARWLDLGDYTDAGKSDDEDLVRLYRQWRVLSDPEVRGEELLVSLSEFMGSAHAILEGALESLGAGGRETLFGRHAGFCESWYRSHFPKKEDQGEPEVAALRKSYVGRLLIRPQADRAKIFAVGDLLARLAGAEFVGGLRDRLGDIKRPAVEVDGFSGDVLAVEGEGESRVVLGGRKKTVYDAPAALIIDLGGNDIYHRAAVVDDEAMLASVVLDVSGNDLYESDDPGPAYAVGGVAILADLRGNDRYVSGRLGQAVSALGFALLVDGAGDDEYTLEDFGQGYTLCGVALLYDLRGDDRYTAWAYAQGSDIGYGLGALVDGKGDDHYLADLHWPDVYGTSGPDVYHGASQGYATGVRGQTGGGLAVLLDLGAGKDRYQAGSFSQAGGYFFSFGLLYDGGGDDESYGSRYAQGFGVHQGVGVHWDAGGDDLYRCRSVAHAGMAWDEGIGYFLDDGGDDTYELGDLALGGAAQTGIAICIEGGGKDRYKTGIQSLGGTGSSEYHDLPSIGVLIDLGGKKDDYAMEKRGDGLFVTSDGASIFIDCRERDLTALARSRLFK